jgi:RimJ/RimL family protein N-acetyltransferase
MSAIIFAGNDERLGEFALRPVDPAADAALLHRWLTDPKSAFWLMGNASMRDVEAELRRKLLFADPATRRVVVEPDVRNRPVHALNEAVASASRAPSPSPARTPT